LVDESTDVSITQTLAFVVRFLDDEQKNKTADQLLDIIEMGTSEGGTAFSVLTQ